MATRFGACFWPDADHVGRTVARRQLHHAKAITAGDEAERFRVDRDCASITVGVGGGDIAFMEPYCIRHRKSPDQTKWCGL